MSVPAIYHGFKGKSGSIILNSLESYESAAMRLKVDSYLVNLDHNGMVKAFERLQAQNGL